MRNILVFLIAAASFIAAGCAPQNLAQGKSASEVPEANGKRDNAAHRSDNSAATNSVAVSRATATAIPKSVVKKVTNEICPDPAKPCHQRQREFADWELPFRLPAKIVSNKTYSSQEFYAVILRKQDEACEDGLDYDEKIEAERINVQKRFPKNKVFAEYSCPNLDAVSYDFKGKLDAKGEYVLYMNYIAVYAGATETDAQEILESVRADYPNAVIKKMKANYERLEM